MKKRLLVVAILAVALASCGKSSSAYKGLKAQFDSIAAVNASNEYEMSEMDSLISSVLLNFQEISAMEGMINLNPITGDVKQSQKDRINDNMRLISEKLRSNRESIETLSKKLKATGQENGRLMKTLNLLKQQLESKTAEIGQLQQELEKKNLAIGILDSALVSQTAETLRQQEANQALSEENARQEKALNTVRYCIGTKSDLKDMKVLKSGNVTTEGYDEGYFTRADLRTLSQIQLKARKAQLLTNHPASSYELLRGEDKMLTLKIKDPQSFWSHTKVLVVQTN